MPDDTIGPPAVPARPASSARRLLLVAVLIVLAETVGYVVLAALDLRDMDGDRVGSAVGIAVLLAGYGVAQLVAVIMLLRGRAGARSPLIVTQVLQVLVATSLRDEPRLALAVALPAVVVLACVLSPPVTRALQTEPG